MDSDVSDDFPPEEDTILCREVLDSFAPHGEDCQPKDDSYIGWITCDEMHGDELEFCCEANKPYCKLHLTQVALAESRSQAFMDRPSSAQISSKPRKKFVSASMSNLSIRKSKSTRCITSTTPVISPYRLYSPGSSTAPPGGRGMFNNAFSKRQHRAVSDPSLRYISKFPMLFHGLRDIRYDFKPFTHHQQHVDAYRKTYTYILISNYRELRARGITEPKLHEALRLNMCNNNNNNNDKPHTEGVCRELLHHPRCTHQTPTVAPSQPHKRAPTPPPVIYLSESCPSGPVVYNRSGSSKSGSSRASDVIMTAVTPSTICGGSGPLPKSTMEMNSVMVKATQQRPFGEQESGFKGHKSLVKSPRPWKPPSAETARRRRGNPPAAMSMVVGSSAVGKSRGGIRRMSPLGRVPVPIRRSSPSIRGRRDPSGSTSDGAKYLSIAMATHTVTSPYYRAGDDANESVTMM